MPIRAVLLKPLNGHVWPICLNVRFAQECAKGMYKPKKSTQFAVAVVYGTERMERAFRHGCVWRNVRSLC